MFDGVKFGTKTSRKSSLNSTSPRNFLPSNTVCFLQIKTSVIWASDCRHSHLPETTLTKTKHQETLKRAATQSPVAKQQAVFSPVTKLSHQPPGAPEPCRVPTV